MYCTNTRNKNVRVKFNDDDDVPDSFQTTMVQ